MNSRFIARLLLLNGAALGLFCLTGCQNQKVVARVRNQPITEEQVAARAMRLTAQDMQQVSSLDAGGAALLSTIRETLSDMYCTEKGYQPSQEEVNKMVTYIQRRNPSLDAAIKAGKTDSEDLRREQKFLMEEVAIGTDGAQVNPDELKKEYEERKKFLTVPKVYTMRLLPVPSEAAGTQILPELKKSGDYKAAAAKLNMPPQRAMMMGQETFLSPDLFEADTIKDLDALTAGKFTEKPLTLKFKPNPSNPQAPQSAVVVGQMVAVTPEYVPTMDEVHFVLKQSILAKKFPQWEQHKNQVVAEYTGKSDLQINAKRYEPLLEVFRLQSQLNAAPPAGAPMTSGGTAVPPTSGGTTAPPSSAPTGSGGFTPPPAGAGK